MASAIREAPANGYYREMADAYRELIVAYGEGAPLRLRDA